MARFEQLPAELQIHVFSYLTKSDVKAARGVSRKFRDNATPELFRSILACARYRAIGAFQNISLHSVYPSYVKEIVFDGSVYDASLARSERAYELMQKELQHQRGSYWGMRTKWKRYQTLYNDQQDMKADGVLLQTMARALEWMPNISRIVYSPHADHVLPVEAKDMHGLIQRSLSDRARVADQPDHPFRYLIGAIFVTKFAGIREFRAERYQPERNGTRFSLDMFDFPQAGDLEAAQYFFQNLTKLELNMTFHSHSFRMGGHDAEASQRATQRLRNLAKLITGTSELRHLALHLSDWKATPQLMYGHLVQNDEPIFRSLGLRASWSKLRSLSLEGVHAHEEDFLSLIRRHKDTLKSLAFSECTLTTGAWAEIVDEVLYSSYLNTFELDRVNEQELPGYSWMSLGEEEAQSLRYEGYLVVAEDGDRNFADINSTKKSVYHLRR